jgi:hypothetical protein
MKNNDMVNNTMPMVVIGIALDGCYDTIFRARRHLRGGRRSLCWLFRQVWFPAPCRLLGIYCCYYYHYHCSLVTPHT